MRVLGIKIPLFGAKLDVRTNPDGDGKILQANAGTWKIRIKLKWFGIRINAGYNSLLYIEDYAHTRPYSTSAGSNSGSRIGIVGPNASAHSYNLSNNHWLFNFFHYNNVNDGDGCIKFAAHVGLNGYFSANTKYKICTDGPYFGFVPVESALDYGQAGTLTLGRNLEALNINSNLSNIPPQADIMLGIPSSFNSNPGKTNFAHVSYRNDDIFNLTNAPSPGSATNLYFSCVAFSNVDTVRRGFLNLEIGDEELFLENNVLLYTAQYKVEYDLHVNERNRHYQYPSTPITNPFLRGIYSKENQFSISPTGFATFIYDATNAPPGHFGFYGTTTGSFTQVNEPLINCCTQSYTSGGRGVIGIPTAIKAALKKDSYLHVYPNPNNGNHFTVKYQLGSFNNAIFTLRNFAGKMVCTQRIFIPPGKINIFSSFNLSSLNLSAGLYLATISSSSEKLTTKMVVIK